MCRVALSAALHSRCCWEPIPQPWSALTGERECCGTAGAQARPATAPLPRLEQFSARCSSGRRRVAADTTTAAAAAAAAAIPSTGRGSSSRGRATASTPAIQRTGYVPLYLDPCSKSALPPHENLAPAARAGAMVADS